MKIKNILSVLTATALSLSLLAACGNSGDKNTPATVKSDDGKELQVLRVANMTGQPDQYADYIGTEQGIFEKYGISLETTEFVAGINTVDAIVNGTADTGLLADFAAVNRFGNTLADTNLVICSDLSTGAEQKSDSELTDDGGIYVAPQYADDISALDGSEGWITNIGTVSEYYNWQAQTYLGLDPSKQKIVQTDSVSTQLAVVHNGEASAAVVTGSLSDKYKEEGWVKIASTDEVGINISAYLITTREFAENNTDLLADYFKALDESVKYINENLDDSAKKISEKFGIEEEDFKLNWSQYSIKYGLSEEGAAHLDEINNWAFENGKYPEAYNIRQFYYTKAAEKAFPDNVTVDLSSVEK